MVLGVTGTIVASVIAGLLTLPLYGSALNAPLAILSVGVAVIAGLVAYSAGLVEPVAFLVGAGIIRSVAAVVQVVVVSSTPADLQQLLTLFATEALFGGLAFGAGAGAVLLARLYF